MTQPKDSERIAFESKCADYELSTYWDENMGGYGDVHTRMAWSFWKAAKQSTIAQSQSPLIFVGGGHLREICNGNEMPIYAISEQDWENRLVPLYGSPPAQLAVSGGWKLVPIEADDSMVIAGGLVGTHKILPASTYRDIYKAMLSASPTPPISQVEGG